MKEFKYTINGNKYEVTIGNIEGRNVELTVNGEPYTVQIEPNEVKKERVKVSAPKPAQLHNREHPLQAAMLSKHLCQALSRTSVWLLATQFQKARLSLC